MRTIEILISPSGESHIETKGFSGSECRLASHFLEQALGQLTQEQLTPEFYSTSSEQQSLQAGE